MTPGEIFPEEEKEQIKSKVIKSAVFISFCDSDTNHPVLIPYKQPAV